MRADGREAAGPGANAAPFSVLDHRYGISGGQPAEVFTRAVEPARTGREVTAPTPAAEACEPDGACAGPHI
ncbi:hypothetical protein ACWFQ8_16015 [Streptomyces sp. NPDC055254]